MVHLKSKFIVYGFPFFFLVWNVLMALKKNLCPSFSFSLYQYFSLFILYLFFYFPFQITLWERMRIWFQSYLGEKKMNYNMIKEEKWYNFEIGWNVQCWDHLWHWLFFIMIPYLLYIPLYVATCRKVICKNIQMGFFFQSNST